MIYGYCRVSTNKQNIERQVRNISTAFPNSHIVREVFTGTKFQGRKELYKILDNISAGDTIVFDSVSRMSRNANEGFQLYERLLSKGVNLVFLKEPYINTEVYKQALQNSIKATGNEIADIYIEATNKVFMLLAEMQIRIAFDQSEKEVADLHQRTKEGIETARLNGKQIGLSAGTKLTTKKSMKAKEQIKKYNNTFGGALNNEETWKLIGISKTAFYKYKGELLDEINN